MEIAIIILCSCLLLLSIVAIVLISKKQAPQIDISPIISEMDRLNKSEMDNTARLLSNSNQSIASGIKNQLDANITLINSFLSGIKEGMTALEQRQNHLAESVNKQMDKLATDNKEQLDRMRETVDEKLTKTIESRFNQSFQRISDSLEQVTKGLAEMTVLTGRVTDLNKILGGIKNRGILGEISLGSILEEILSPEQYRYNFPIGKGREAVEYVIVLPGKGDGEVFLPIDAKFPLADYERLQDALEKGDKDGAKNYSQELEKAIRTQAKNIKDKYVIPPTTTDFAILYLPIEGLFAEVIRRPGLLSELQSKFHIMVAGPTTLCALLNSLQMGFQTLMVEKKSQEIHKLLSTFRQEFSRFNEIIDKACKQIETASNSMQEAKKKTETIKKKLSTIESIDPPDNP